MSIFSLPIRKIEFNKLFDFRIKVTEKSDTEIVLVANENKAVIKASPFRVDFYHNDLLTVSANAKGLMRFEHLRKKSKP